MDNKDFDFSQLEELSVDSILGESLSEELEMLPQEPAEDPDVILDQLCDEFVAEPNDNAKCSEVPHHKKEKSAWQKSFLMYVHDLIFLLAGIVVIFMLLFRVVVVSGTSMNSTLLDGDYLLLLGNIFYRNPQAGDIIVISKASFDNGSPIVKRVIATEGQTVDIDFKAGIVYVDGVALVEPYTLTPTTVREGMEFPLVVSEGCLFVLGDNRDGSKDSRNPEIGLIDKREVLGKVIFLFMPGTNMGKEQRDLGRIGVVS